MLYIIGTGLADEKDISLKGLEAIKSCSEIYLEIYTSKINCDIAELEKLYEQKITPVDRDFVEDGKQIIKEAKENNIALLIIGDPLSATTHWDLMARAKEEKIPTKIIHNASIFSAVATTGLQLYKFGKTASIPHPKPNFEPETAYNIIKQNQSIDAHTLCLLDTQPTFMTVNEAIQTLLNIEKKRSENVFTEGTLCIGCARIGATDQIIKAGKAKELLKQDFGHPVHCLIIPSKLHFVEEEALRQFS